MKQLTIIIPTRNKPQSLMRLMRSIKKNTSPELTQIILVSDSDPGKDVLFKDIIHIYSGGYRLGPVMATWKGIFLSNSQFVGVLGDDCEIITPDIDSIIIDSMVNNSFSFMVFGLNDGIQEGRAHPFMSRFDWLCGYGQPPVYGRFYADTEIYKINKHLNLWYHIKEAKIIHHHEYAAKLGQDVKVLEDPASCNNYIRKQDGEIFKRRMKWWEDNNKPVSIPWYIT